VRGWCVQGEVEQSACSGMVLTDLVAVPVGDVGRPSSGVKFSMALNDAVQALSVAD
jgi:hypothetical protein